MIKIIPKTLAIVLSLFFCRFSYCRRCKSYSMAYCLYVNDLRGWFYAHI